MFIPGIKSNDTFPKNMLRIEMMLFLSGSVKCQEKRYQLVVSQKNPRSLTYYWLEGITLADGAGSGSFAA